MDYNELIDNVKGIHDKYTIVEGYMDMYQGGSYFFIKEIDCYWVLIGKASVEEIELCLTKSEYEVEKEGCYKFDIVLKYESPEYDDYGRQISGGYWYIDHGNFELDHTFEQREREHKISNLLEDINLDIFNI